LNHHGFAASKQFWKSFDKRYGRITLMRATPHLACGARPGNAADTSSSDDYYRRQSTVLDGAAIVISDTSFWDSAPLSPSSWQDPPRSTILITGCRLSL